MKDKQGLWSPDADAIHQAKFENPSAAIEANLGQSESMGLLDAERFKFLDHSDSNSEGNEDEADE